MLAYARFHGRDVLTVDVCKEALKDLLSVSNGQITVENIQKTVADFYKIKVADMYSKRRPANIALPRQVAMYLAKELTQKSLPEIGDLFGGRDHTTVLHAVRKISDARAKQAELNHTLHVLEQTLKDEHATRTNHTRCIAETAVDCGGHRRKTPYPAHPGEHPDAQGRQQGCLHRHRPEVQITTHADFGVGQDNESTTVAARKLLDILKALPDTGEVKLALASNKLSVQSAKSRFALQTLAASEFPTVAQPEQWDVSLTLPQRTLRHLFNMVHFAMAQQDIRYYLNGMLLVFEPGRVRAVATDGHRLAHCSTEADGIKERHEVIVPRKTVLEMQRLLEDSDEPVSIDVAPGQIRFRFGDVELVSKLVEGKFPISRA